MSFLPRPLQQPRIPISCGAHWPHRRPLRRAASYDGVVPIGDLPPADLATLVGEIATSGAPGAPFDVAIPSWTASAPPASYEDAGATWWLEAFRPDTPLETAQNVVLAGRR